MSDAKWTPAQKQAIEAETGALLVSAAAGSGKTTVLVERVVRLLTRAENPVRADRMLILTFTNAAAAELSARLAARLEQAMEEQGASPFLREQKMLLQRAFIGTIDAFSLQLVREHFAQLDLPADIGVGDGALLAALEKNALAETMEEMYEDADFVRLAGLYGRARSDQALQEAILRLEGETRVLPDPEAHLDGVLALYEGGAPLAETPWGKELLHSAQNSLQGALEQNARAVEALDADPALVCYAPMLEDDRQTLIALVAMAAQGDWDGMVDVLRSWQPARLAAARNCDEAAKERVKALREGCKKTLVDLRDRWLVCTADEFEADRRAALPLVGVLVAAVRLYAGKLWAAKQEEKMLDFPDVEHLALGLLWSREGGKTREAGRIADRYDLVMVDEYQDTNALQDTLYQCVSKEDNLFLVGDVKQSIYRFRQADPGIFLRRRADWPRYDGERHSASIHLGHNFRSGCGVVNGVNALFSDLMSEALGELRYDEGEWLIQGAPGGDEAGFEMMFVDGADGPGEAVAVARRIAAMVAGGFTVREKGAERPCGYGDFAILLRTKKLAREYIAALQAHGIPAVADGADDLLQSPEVLPLAAALAAIDNPGDEVALSAALLGPIFHFTLDEVAALRAENPVLGLWGMLTHSEDAKARRFVGRLAYYRGLSSGMPVGQLCRALCERSGYESAVAAMEGGTARRHNLRRFLAWADEMSAAGRGALPDFVRLLRDGKGPDTPGFRALPGHVGVLSIHKSKGLEFPICFVADTTHRINLTDLNSRVLTHSALGVGLYLEEGRLLYPTLPLLAIRSRGRREVMSEEMRLLYVALTRAKDRVITVGRYDDLAVTVTKRAQDAAGPPESYTLLRNSCFADWLLAALLYRPDAAPLYEYAGLETPFFKDGEKPVYQVSIEQGEQGSALPEAAVSEGLTATPDPARVARLAEKFRQPIPRRALADIPAKVSVSALAKERGESPLRRPSFMYAGGLTAAERGTLQHSFLQHADLALLHKDLFAEIDRQVDEGLLDAQGAQRLDRKGLMAFTASPLAARMRGAERLYREYDFITSLPASALKEGLPPELADEPVQVQGIADAVLVSGGAAEIVDYKTDRVSEPGRLVALYQKQLMLYRDAVQKRLGMPVTRLTIWSFALGCEIAIEP